MLVIKISDFSQEAASKTKGIQLREKLEPLIKNGEKFCVDFEGITRFASPFFNNSFASLALVYGFEAIENIETRNLSEIGKLALHTSMENAQLLFENPQFTEKINSIINENLPKKDE